MHIIGTAGHVDHGKSSLVTALTGTNPDRWIEEQRRGMTLDLGFAHLRFEDGREAGIVDVPGHERFLHNMLAGASGMDVLLLVIAANEGVMPQTVEHLNILRFLNVRRVVVALTKMDLIEPSRGGAVCQEIHRALQGTIAQDASIFAVSTVTGTNLDALKSGLAWELAQLVQHDADAPAYLPIDRVFTLAGRGTIVTGTLMQGRIASGDTLALQPSGRSARVRSLQVFGEPRDAASGGTRVALNLASIEKTEIARGDVLTDAQLEARTSYEVEFEPLSDAAALMRRRTHVRAHIGAAEVLGTLVLPQAPVGGERLRGALHLREPVLAFPGVRFVVRRVSPKTLLGGGEIRGVEAAEPVESGSSIERSLRALLRSSATPLDAQALAFAANAREEIVQSALERLGERGEVIRIERPVAYVDAESAAALAAALERELESLHKAEPWAMGATSIALSRAMRVEEPFLVRILAAFVSDGRLAARSGYYCLPDHQPRLSGSQREFFEEAMPFDPAQPFLPAEFREIAAKVKAARIDGLTKAFETLLVRGTLVKVGDGLYRGSQVEQIHAHIERFIAEHERITMAEFRDVLHTSRKYAVPLLEWFDSHGITVRSGDYRTLRTRRGAHPPAV